MSVHHMRASVPVSSVRRVWVDLLVGPFSLALVLLLSSLFPVRAQAQTNMTLQQLVPNLIRNISQTVSASPSGLAVRSAGAVDIGVGAMNTGNGIIGRVMINEVRSIPLATVASRAVTSTLPGIVALIAVDLAIKGITQCVSSPNGWCKPGSVNTSSTDTGFTGYQWNGAGGLSDSAYAACVAGAGPNGATFTSVTVNGANGSCLGKRISDGSVVGYGVNQVATCVKNYIVVNGACAPDPSVSAPPVPATYPDLSPMLLDVLNGNPSRAKDYWGFEPWTEQSSWLGDPATQALPAEVTSPADGTVTGPTTTTQTPSGTSSTTTKCTVVPNSDSNSLANKPVSVACTQTTTNPDGTTSTTTTTTTPTTGDGSNPQPAPVPASSPIPCGLGTNGSPKCQIDETGTPTKTDATTAMAQPATDLQTAEQTAVTQLNNVNNGLSWTLHMPHILPGGTCQPIEWFSWGSWRGSWDVCTQLQYVRDLLAWLWPVLSAVYVWNKAAGANAGVV